jgi:hypothetical protein
MSLAVTVPDTLEMLLGEVLNLNVDMTNVIAAGDSISNPILTLTSTQSVETVPSALSLLSVTAPAIINVTISAVKLRPKTTYELQFNCTATGGLTNKTPSAILTIVVIQ